MTKIQIKKAAMELCVEHTKKLNEALDALLTDYAETSRPTKRDERAKVIKQDGNTYVWCNRHDVYELRCNFRTEKHAECNLARTVWNAMNVELKELNEALLVAATSPNNGYVADIASDIRSLKLKRGGKFNLQEDMEEYNYVKGYNYNLDSFVCE